MTPNRPARTSRARVAAALLVAPVTVLVALAPLAAAEPLAAGPARSQQAPATVPVSISNYAFSPPELMVNVGDTVTWTNADAAPHDVTSTDAPAPFSSGTLQTGGTFSYTFTAPGSYKYVCTLHPGMSASVLAMDAAPAAPPAPPVDAAAPPPAEAVAPPPAPAAGGAPAAGPAPGAPVQGPPPQGPPVHVAQAPATVPAPGTTQVASTAAPGPTLDPLLLVAGIAMGVATLCLLLIGTQSANRPPANRPPSDQH